MTMPSWEEFEPNRIRGREFSVRMRGYEPEEVAEYLGELADLIADLQEENARLVRTNRELRAERSAAVDGGERPADRPFGWSPPAETEIPVRPSAATEGEAILTQAQQMADQLLADAEVEARQRVADAADVDLVDYVRTYARVTHDQMKGVLDQLGRQLDRLHDLASRDAHGEAWDEAHED